MSKKHFIAIADAIRWHDAHYEQYGQGFSFEHLTALIEVFQYLNPRFDASKFLYYVGKP